MQRYLVRVLTILGGLIFLAGSLTPAFAAAVTPPAPTTISVQTTPPPNSAPGLIMTAIAGSALPDFVELYNQSNEPVNLAGWQLAITVHDSDPTGCADATVEIDLPDAYMLSKKYLTLERTDTPDPTSLTTPFSLDSAAFLAGCITPKLTTVTLLTSDDQTEQAVTIPAGEWSGTTVTVAQHKQRNNSPSSTRAISGVFDTDYKIVSGAITLNSDPLYTPPADTAGLQLLEILPNARSCSPLETDPACNDYIKLYNPTDQPINLALYRLRAGYKGQSESLTNTFTWGGEINPSSDELILPPAQYFMLSARNDGQPLSITDSGDYVWVEDAYGTTVYDPIIEYPDASSTTKIGQAWAYDGDVWRWTSAPQPGAANYFPPEVAVPTTTVTSVSTLKPCDDNQYRNPITNRCNTIAIASAALAPCGEGEERNPATNRCRQIATASSELTPCQPGWERNPDTNRCRKVATVAGASTTAVTDVAAPTNQGQGWFVAALALSLAGFYAVYEWRQDIRLFARNTQSKLLARFKRPSA